MNRKLLLALIGASLLVGMQAVQAREKRSLFRIGKDSVSWFYQKAWGKNTFTGQLARWTVFSRPACFTYGYLFATSENPTIKRQRQNAQELLKREYHKRRITRS